MSLDIHWDQLDHDLEKKIIKELNARFRSLALPEMCGYLEVTDFSFGAVPPSLTLTDITDPFPEFYIPEDGYEEEEEDDDDNHLHYDHSGLSSINGSAVLGPDGGPWDPTGRSDSAPVWSRPHPRLPTYSHTQQPSVVGSLDDTHSFRSLHGLPPSTMGIGLRSFPTHPHLDPRHDPHRSPHLDPNIGSPSPSPGDAEDVQIKIDVEYSGDMRLDLRTELRLNFPSQAFLSLPVRLIVTGFAMKGTGVVAYMGDRVNFCFLPPKNPEEGVLQDIHVESEIGDRNKQVLKNVGKIERFVVDHLRKYLDEEFVFPSYYSLDVLPPSQHPTDHLSGDILPNRHSDTDSDDLSSSCIIEEEGTSTF